MEIENLGHTNKIVCSSKLKETGDSFSPFPSEICTPPSIKKGTSQPNLNPMLRKSSFVAPNLNILFNIKRMLAALLEPPPKPAPTGIFLFK